MTTTTTFNLLEPYEIAEETFVIRGPWRPCGSATSR